MKYDVRQLMLLDNSQIVEDIFDMRLKLDAPDLSVR